MPYHTCTQTTPAQYFAGFCPSIKLVFANRLVSAAGMRAALLALATATCSALLVPTPPRSYADSTLSRKPTRRSFLLALPALAAPTTAFAAATGGGSVTSQIETKGGGPPKIGELAKLTKGEPGPEELKRLAQGYQRLEYLLSNWEKETTVCIKGCKGSYENCGCTRDPVIVQSYMGYKSMNDPLFKAGDLMMRASPMVQSDADFDRYNDAMTKWTQKADSGNIMAYVSSWGEANPGGGQDEIARYLEKSRKDVVDSANLLKTVMDILSIPKVV